MRYSEDQINQAINEKLGFCTNCMKFTTSNVYSTEANTLCKVCKCYSIFGAITSLERGFFVPESAE